tara:strand:- start:193 stop:369 length:177 start_codon:yes stop_codon:yes gene_type:complete
MDEENTIILIAAVFFSIFLSVFGGWYLSISEQQAKAAQTECARYHPDTGKFEWLGEED